jgi:hypothetical protein
MLTNVFATLPAALQHEIVLLSALSHSSFAHKDNVSKPHGYHRFTMFLQPWPLPACPAVIALPS